MALKGTAPSEVKADKQVKISQSDVPAATLEAALKVAQGL